MRGKSSMSATALTAVVIALGGATATSVDAQEVDEIRSLRGERPNLPNLNGIVRSRTTLAVLGKALFWDEGVGSDGVACATCHFHGGADLRITNQYNPGGPVDDIAGNGDDKDFDLDHEVNQTAFRSSVPVLRSWC